MTQKRKRRLPANVSAFVDRHGKERFRFRQSGRAGGYFSAPPETPEFEAELAAFRAAAPAPAGRGRIVPGTINDLVACFYRSTAFNNASPETRRTRRGIIEAFRREHGGKRVAKLGFEHVEAILLAKSKKRVDPETGRTIGGKVAAASLRKQLKRMFRLAVKLGMAERNPAEEAEGVKVPKGGFHSWTEEEIARYQERHPLGTPARLALEIILWTGQRRGDAHRFGRRHLKGRRIHYTQAKGGKDLWLPAAPQLLEAIAAMPVTGTDAFLVTAFGKPFSKAGFGNKMRQWCDEAGLPHCSAHGLRKAMARRLAEDGASQVEIKAAGGWSNDQEVATYTAAADQRRLAEASLGGLARRDLANRAQEKPE
jgi:integrase